MRSENGVLKSARSGIKWTTTSTVFNSIIKLLQVSILTRILMKEDFGIVAIALLVNSFCLIFADMGFSAAVLHKKEIDRNEFSSLYWFNVLVALILTVITIALASPISYYYGEVELTGIIHITALNILFTSFASLQRTIQQKNMKFRFISICEIISGIIVLISAIVLAFMNYGIYSLVYSTVIGSAFIGIVYFVNGFFVEKSLILHCKINEIYSGLKIGVYQVGSSIFDFFSQEIDTLVISSTMTMEVFGGYTLCKQIILRVFSLINPIITRVLTPTLAIFQNDKKVLASKMLNSINILSNTSFFIYSLIGINSYMILYVLYGETYTSLSIYLLILSLTYSVQSISSSFGCLAIASGRTDLGLQWTLFRILLSSIILIITSSFGIYYLLTALLLMNVVNVFFVWLILVRKIVYIKISSIYRAYLFNGILSLTIYTAVQIIFNDGQNLFNSLIRSILFVLFYVSINYIFNKKYTLKTLKIEL